MSVPSLILHVSVHSFVFQSTSHYMWPIHIMQTQKWKWHILCVTKYKVGMWLEPQHEQWEKMLFTALQVIVMKGNREDKATIISSLLLLPYTQSKSVFVTWCSVHSKWSTLCSCSCKLLHFCKPGFMVLRLNAQKVMVQY